MDFWEMALILDILTADPVKFTILEFPWHSQGHFVQQRRTHLLECKFTRDLCSAPCLGPS